MSSNLKANCYEFATGCRKLCFSSVGCREPEKVGEHWRIHMLDKCLVVTQNQTNIVMSINHNDHRKQFMLNFSI